MSLPYLKDVLLLLHEDVVVSMKGMSSLKGPPTLQARGQDHSLPSPCELLELPAQPILNSIHLQYQTAGRRAITS
jgi:hypothetical protein